MLDTINIKILVISCMDSENDDSVFKAIAIAFLFRAIFDIYTMKIIRYISISFRVTRVKRTG